MIVCLAKCSKCGVDIYFRKVVGEAPKHLKSMYSNGETKWIPINDVDGRNHFETCLKNDERLKSDERLNIVFCVDCEELNHNGGVCTCWEDWVDHSKIYGHNRYRRWSHVEIKTCKCIKYCYGK